MVNVDLLFQQRSLLDTAQEARSVQNSRGHLEEIVKDII